MLTFYFFFVALASTLLAASNDAGPVGLSSGVAVLFFSLAALSLIGDLHARVRREHDEPANDIERRGA